MGGMTYTQFLVYNNVGGKYDEGNPRSSGVQLRKSFPLRAFGKTFLRHWHLVSEDLADVTQAKEGTAHSGTAKSEVTGQGRNVRGKKTGEVTVCCKDHMATKI